MACPKPLLPTQAKRTLANRFVGLADRLRQLNTTFGLRSKRVFLVWSKFGGIEVGEGDEHLLARHEILPTPKVADLSAVTLNPFSAGKLPVGVIRVTEISETITFDELTGRKVPGRSDPIAEPIDFFFEVVEDGRGDAVPERQRYRLFSVPNRNEGRLQWEVLLERQSRELGRNGRPVPLDDL